MREIGGNNSSLPDSVRDEKELEAESFNLDLPDVKDIPGQENIKPAPMGDFADDTIASADEEGDAIFNDNIDDDIEEDTDSNVSNEEKGDLEKIANNMPTEDDINLRKSALDNTYDDGTPLNEGSFKNNITGPGLMYPAQRMMMQMKKSEKKMKRIMNIALGVITTID